MNREKADKPTNEARISICISDEIERGVYVNRAVIAHSQREFILDLGILVPPGNKIKIQSRVITNPIDAKILYLLLKENIEKYEQRFGSIPVQKSPPPQDSVSSVH